MQSSDVIDVEKLDACQEGEEVQFDVLMLAGEDAQGAVIGKPLVAGAARHRQGRRARSRALRSWSTSTRPRRTIVASVRAIVSPTREVEITAIG